MHTMVPKHIKFTFITIRWRQRLASQDYRKEWAFRKNVDYYGQTRLKGSSRQGWT